MRKNLAVIILAAGKGTRMKSSLPKVMHPLCGREMILYVTDLLKELKAQKSVAVLGFGAQEVKKIIPAGINTVLQKQLKGSADAVKVGLSALKGFRGAVLVLYGDMPLLKKESIKKLLDFHFANKSAATILTVNVDKPQGYGRILRDKYFSISGIIEEKDTDDFQKGIKEINTGIICFEKAALEAALKQVKPNNAKKEYYLTDVISIFYKKGLLVEGIKLTDINEAMGINSKNELSRANLIMRQRINEEYLNNGVMIVDPASTFINYGTKIGQDTVIYPFTVIERNVKIGKRCNIGPFAHLRDEAALDDDVIVGNFLEITRSKLAAKTIAKHFAYLGDSLIGKNVNIGAGTVIANFDGKNKNQTVIGDNSFIGSDSVLVSPVKIGKFAKTGAGSVVLGNTKVKDNAVVAGVPARVISRSLRGDKIKK